MVKRYETNPWCTLYTEDANSDTCDIIEVHYCDPCEGEKCYVIEEPSKFVQKRPIYAPVFIDNTFNSLSWLKAKVLDYWISKKGIIYVELSKPLMVGDILVIDTDCEAKYYIDSRSRDFKHVGKMVFTLKRLDGKRPAQIDEIRLKRATYFKVIGGFSDKTRC